ncbi:hypothetical protein P152DRAFT_110769 [Eremomyces bilateralis CBS 781.70]|uniref:Protein kinase domain-containing protein n=1 Tax=Eremomyces bilateralis CBS 781.70 TaxID=1392243 RepID=A0A6G1GDJ0_9PEZI|nr:uncharacterized protein P152DRAFT_110769 [Eremomyces bilateralis CBS 781.70]KAF1816108.1 hypothetical protein P152DRAFT_110769 [Eremomyces bilateralis CBS 781.70]
MFPFFLTSFAARTTLTFSVSTWGRKLSMMQILPGHSLFIMRGGQVLCSSGKVLRTIALPHSILRLYKDVIPGKSTFVFEYFTGHLLQLAQKGLPISTTKKTLKDALLGIAELHDQEIIHTGMFYRVYSL